MLLRNRRKRPQWAVWIVHLTLALTTAACGSPNLVENPGFEEDQAWTWRGSGQTGVTFLAVPGGRSGDRAAMIRVRDDAPMDWYQWRQTLAAAAPGTSLDLSGWVRTEQARGATGACISVSACDSRRHRLGFADSQRVSGTHDWTLVWTSYTIPPGPITYS